LALAGGLALFTGGCGGSNHFVTNRPAGLYRGTFYGDQPVVVAINPDRTVYITGVYRDNLYAAGSGNLTFENSYAAYVFTYIGGLLEARETADGSRDRRETFGTFVYGEKSISFYASYGQAPNTGAFVGHYTGTQRLFPSGPESAVEGDVDSSGRFAGTLTLNGVPTPVTGRVKSGGGFDLDTTQNGKNIQFVGAIDPGAEGGGQAWGRSLSDNYAIHLTRH